MLEENIKLRNKAESRFQAFFDREINKLRNDFRNESEVKAFNFLDEFSFFTFIFKFISLQVREREDDEIIEALNRYTLKLQNSLKVVNSTDM
jgi:hypothetical protein